MKKIFFLTALAVMVLASCNRNEDEMGSAGGEKATLNISIQSPKTYAGSATAPIDEIGNFTVFITDQTDEIKWKAYSSDGTALTGANAVPVTTQAKHVYVVANGGNLTSITTMAALNTKIIDLNGTDVKQSVARWATGVSAPLSFTQSGNDFTATTSVLVTFVAARIKVTIALAGEMATNYSATPSDAGSLVLTKVAVLNARGQSLLFGTPATAPAPPTSLIPTYTSGKKYYEGLENPSPVGFDNYPTDNFTVAADILSDNTLVADYNATTKFTGKAYYYYVFENDATAAADQPTIVLLKGTYDSKDIYFPVHLAPYEQLSTGSPVNGITRGNSYNVAITLSGNPSKTGGGDYPGGTGGTDDPTEPLISAKVNVTVSLTPWTDIAVPKTFN